MSKLKLSIILPCYNVDQYIIQCLDSLYNQNIPETEYEVICINDCSSDSTRDYILSYQQKHQNLILMDHEVNKQQGAARNTGLNVAKGDYVWFVDPDDYVENNIFDELLNMLLVNDLDVLQFNSYQVDVNGSNRKPYRDDNIENANCIDGRQYYNTTNPWELQIESWARIYNRNYLISKSLFYPEIGYGEDDLHTLYSMFYANRIHMIDKFYYYYRQNPASTMSTPFGFNKLYQKCFVVGSRIIKFSEEIKSKDNKFSLVLYEGGIWRINQFLKPLIKLGNTDVSLFFNIIKENSGFINELFPYLKYRNKIILKYPFFSKPIIHTMSFIQDLLKKKSK